MPCSVLLCVGSSAVYYILLAGDRDRERDDSLADGDGCVIIIITSVGCTLVGGIYRLDADKFMAFCGV